MRYSSRSYELLWLSMALLMLMPIAYYLSITPHDYWYYVRIGQDIVQNGAIPTIETLSYTYAGTPIFEQPWLAEVIFWFTYSWGGAALTFLLRGVTISIAYAIVWVTMREAGTGTKLATLLTIIMGFSSSMNWGVRPQMFAYPLFAAGIWVLFRWQAGRNRQLWLLPVLTALWANLHGSFIIAFLLIGAALVFGKGDRKQLGIWLGLSILSTLINPHGVLVWKYVLDMFQSTSVQMYSAEWHPPLNAGWQMNIFFAWILLFIPLAAISERRLSLLEWIWFLGFGWMALSGMRYVIWFMFIMSVLTGALLGKVLERFSRNIEAPTPNPAFNYVLSAFIFIMPLALLPGFRETWWKDAPPVYHETSTATKATAWLQEHPSLPGPIFAEYTFSSYLTFALPGRPVWIDNRFHVYPAKHWQDYKTISDARTGWDTLLDKDGVNLLMLSQTSQPALIEAVTESGEWCEQYRDKYAVILSRCEPIP